MAKEQTVVKSMADLLGIPRDDLVQLLNEDDQPSEFYNLEYYLQTEMSWYAISHGIIRTYIERWLPHTHGIYLDLGCGIGLYAKKLVEHCENGRYVGIDLSKSGLKVAQKLPCLRQSDAVICSSVYTLPLPSSSVGAAFSTEVIEHLEDPSQFFREVCRVLKPGGTLLLTTTTFHYYIAHLLIIWLYKDVLLGARIGRFIERIRLYIKGLSSSDDRARFMRMGLERQDHLQAFTKGDLEGRISQAGLKLVDYEYFNIKNIFPTRLLAPVNLMLRIMFHRSKFYGPNIALSCMKP